MTPTVIISFVVVFAAVMVAVSLGMKFFDQRRKKYVANVLQTITEPPKAQPANLLIAPPDEEDSLVDQLLKHFDVSSQLQQAGLDWTPQRLVTSSLMMCLGGVIAGCMFPVLISRVVSASVFGGVLGFVPYFTMRHKRKKRFNAIEEQFPEALDFLARSMRGGHAFTISLEMIGEELPDPLGQEFRTLFNEQNLGAPIDIALRNMCERVPLLDMRFFASSVMLQRQTGGNLSEILTRLSYVIRERFRLKGQVKAASSHGRMTASILTGLPILTVLGLLVVAPGYLQGMADDPDGLKLIGGAVFAQVIGNYTIKKIINIKV